MMHCRGVMYSFFEGAQVKAGRGVRGGGIYIYMIHSSHIYIYI